MEGEGEGRRDTCRGESGRRGEGGRDGAGREKLGRGKREEGKVPFVVFSQATDGPKETQEG